jgi:3-hydroxyacyl-[acyl-carrier-protein] dehydratase
MCWQDEPDEVREGVFFFDPRDPIYVDHFPGHPVVPGSVIVHAFMLAGGGLEDGEAPWAVENFRFRRFISPGDYAYRIEVAGRHLRCSLLSGPSVVATGALEL